FRLARSRFVLWGKGTCLSATARFCEQISASHESNDFRSSPNSRHSIAPQYRSFRARTGQSGHFSIY
ncbi:MAG: hypothetical protein WBF07_22830, partial [Xanthobacteraceae bacterium]